MTKIAIGTANFCSAYGILNQGSALQPKEVESIFEFALKHGINTFDTALSYGNLFNLLQNKEYLAHLQLVTKFSVMDDHDRLYDSLKGRQFYGLLVHDPSNLSKINVAKLRSWLERMRELGVSQKIGVSVYDMEEIERFHEIMVPDLVQIPLNPLNQHFACGKFKSYILEHNVEVHARSLFLQGILLSEKLPDSLKELTPIWSEFNAIVAKNNTRLATLLAWAMAQDYVDKWVLGVSSKQDLMEIIEKAHLEENDNTASLFTCFKDKLHPLVDPRNWQKS